MIKESVTSNITSIMTHVGNMIMMKMFSDNIDI